MVVLLPFTDIRYIIFFTKTLITILITTNFYRSYACEPLDSYIYMISNSIDPLRLIHQYYKLFILDQLINDRFNSIYMSSYDLVGCQDIPLTLGDIERIRIMVWNFAVINYHVCKLLRLLKPCE